MNKQIVGDYAGLTGVEGLAPCYALCSYSYVGTLVDNNGTFTSQLQDYGCEVLCRSTHNHATEVGGTREEDDVVAFLEKCAIYVAVTLYHSHILLVEALLN